MDEETAQAIDGLSGEIRDVETSLRSEIREVETSLRSEIREVKTSLRSEIREVETSLRSEIGNVETSLRSEIGDVETSLRSEIRVEIGRVEMALGDRIDEARRHTDVLIESVRDDIRIVAEGVVSIQQQVTDLSRRR